MNFESTPRTGNEPLTVQFTADPGPRETLKNIIWDFGDGTTGTGPNPSHTYALAGVRSVTMTADVNGVTCSISKTNCVIVSNPAIYPADFDTWPNEGVAPLTTIFSGVTTPGISLKWDFGDGETQDGIPDNPSVSHVYKNRGVYTVTLTATVPAKGIVFTFTRQNYVHVS